LKGLKEITGRRSKKSLTSPFVGLKGVVFLSSVYIQISLTSPFVGLKDY